MDDHLNILYISRAALPMDKSAILKEIQNINKEGYLQKQSRFLKSWRQYLSPNSQTLGCPDQQPAFDLQGTPRLRIAHGDRRAEGSDINQNLRGVDRAKERLRTPAKTQKV